MRENKAQRGVMKAVMMALLGQGSMVPGGIPDEPSLISRDGVAGNFTRKAPGSEPESAVVKSIGRKSKPVKLKP